LTARRARERQLGRPRLLRQQLRFAQRFAREQLGLFQAALLQVRAGLVVEHPPFRLSRRGWRSHEQQRHADETSNEQRATSHFFHHCPARVSW
jgi:hypothetical protein